MSKKNGSLPDDLFDDLEHSRESSEFGEDVFESFVAKEDADLDVDDDQEDYKTVKSGELQWEPSNIGSEVFAECTGPSIETEHAGLIMPKGFSKQTYYWISCSYKFDPALSQLDIVIRQTGSHPNVMNSRSFSSLKLQVKLEDVWKRKIVLMKSKTDKRFQSTKFSFKDVPEDLLERTNLKMKVFGHFGLLSKSCLCKWYIPMRFCDYKEQTDFKRCSF